MSELTEEWLDNYYKKHPELKRQVKHTTPEQEAIDEDRKKARSKYNASHPRVDGIVFDSQLEADYYGELKLRQRAGDIKGFCRQPQFVLIEGNGEDRAITYSADFIIFNNDGTYEIVDTKGFESETWKRTHKTFRIKFPGLELTIEK